MAKKESKPRNPLASMGAIGPTLPEIVKSEVGNTHEETETDDVSRPPLSVTKKNKDDEWKRFQEILSGFTNIHEKGDAVWVPKVVKKQLDLIRAKAKSNLPIRALAAAMIVVFIEDHKEIMDNL